MLVVHIKHDMFCILDDRDMVTMYVSLIDQERVYIAEELPQISTSQCIHGIYAMPGLAPCLFI